MYFKEAGTGEPSKTIHSKVIYIGTSVALPKNRPSDAGIARLPKYLAVLPIDFEPALRNNC